MNSTNSLLAMRYKDAIWMQGETQRILIIGAGGIGRGLTELLSLLGHYISVMDSDVVELHNAAAQGYKLEDISRPKTTVLSDYIVDKYGLENVNGYVYKIKGSNVKDFIHTNDVIISCVDNMQTRHLIADNFVCDDKLFIDARLTIDTYQFFFIQNQEQLSCYKQDYLFDDNEVDEGACTVRQTQFMAAMLQGNLISTFTNYLANKVVGRNVYPVPFFTSYNNLNQHETKHHTTT